MTNKKANGKTNENEADRFKRIERLFTTALSLTVAERANYLREACADDDALRSEVESLLALQPEAAGFLSMPAAQFIANRDKPTLIGLAINQYEIIAPLGKGGMGEVYLAEDTHLQRKVALKLLPPEFTRDVNRLRLFEQEAHAVSALNHPNIITLFDFGHATKGYFITTEFVDGQTLRARLRESRPLSVGETIEIGLQICSALQAAHAANIIHRDLKPENLMLRRDGYVKVLDFGLAIIHTEQKLNNDTAPESVTHPGMVIGTVSYMSPEQARGHKVDARTDIFSLGVVLYEMLAGCLPFDGETPSDMLAAILKCEPLPLAVGSANDGLPAVVARALAKDRAERYQTIRALAGDLTECGENLQFQTRLASLEKAPSVIGSAAQATPHFARRRLMQYATLMLAVLLLGLFARSWQRRVRQAAPIAPVAADSIKTLAVLPFRFLGSDRAEEYLGLGMTETLITKLSRVRQLTVRPLSAVLKYQNAAVEPDRAARELQTDAVLEGSVQKSGDRLRVTMQLIRAGAAQPLWTEEFDESFNHLFALQDQLAARVARELALRLTHADQQQFAKRPTANPKAYRLYLQGRYFSNKWNAEGVQRAREFYERAIALDPQFAAAYAELAINWARQAERGSVPQAEAARQALALTSKAVALDDTLAEAHAYLGFLRLGYEWDFASAGTEFQRALALNPQQVETRQFYGVYLLARGRADEAIAETRLAVELDPTSLIARSQLGRALYLGRRYDEVIATCQELLQMDEQFAQAYAWLGQTYTQQGRHTAALDALEKANRMSNGRTEMLAALGHAYAVAGRVAEAQQVIADLQARHDAGAKAYFLATIYAGLGDRAAALAQLEAGYRQRDPALILRSKLDPKLDLLRDEPSFIALLQRHGL